ncbi:MAG: PIG-L family deacetylase [Terriglobales bacterium]|jgi:LmbE family N-acetylglucosaminyl deacetylase
MVMFAMLKMFECGWARNRLAAALMPILLVTSTATFVAAQTVQKATTDHAADRSSVDRPSIDSYYEPLPQETGAAGLTLMLRRLQTTARLMQVDAHPDDEDGGMLTLEARGKGVSTLLMTLNRGEGGQNKLGSNLFDVLGVVRTLEVLAADRYYGVEQRFSRVADFGYSKTPEETFQKWEGHDIALADIVRVVRTFRPDVLIARFSGTDRDGHGHHQASAILTREAFRAAADPKRFPEQMAEGLQPWQPKKLYIGNVCGFGASTCDPANYTVKLNTGKEDPLLGMSYVQFAVKGLSHQESQGLAGVSVPKGDRFAFYKLVDSVVESPKDKNGHEQDFLDGIDTTLPGLALRLGDEEKKVPWLREQLAQIQQRVDEAERDSGVGSVPGIIALLSGRKGADDLVKKVQQSSLPEGAKQWLTTELETKRDQFQHAANIALGVQLTAILDAPPASSPESATMAVPGESAAVKSLGIVSGGTPISAKLILDAPGCQRISEGAMSADKPSTARFDFRMTLCEEAGHTRPYWHRHDPQRDALNTIDEPEYQTLPFPPAPFHVSMEYQFQGLAGAIDVPVMVRFKWPDGTAAEHPLAIGPEFSIAVSPSSNLIPVGLRGSTSLKSTARDQASASHALISLQVPSGWRAEPVSQSIEIPKDKSEDAAFQVFPSELREGQTHIRADLTGDKKSYREGYSVVTREDLGTFYYYQPAVQLISIVDVKVPKDLKVGYIMGAGDDIPTVLEQIGMDVTMIPADELASEDLSKYQTIVLGIRAYDTQKGVIANNKRLLDFVENGGRLVVQYNTMGSFGVPIDFNAGKYTPYPATLSRTRVSVEEAPVTILDPANPIFHSPNEITQKDFEGWVQERGLYFMSQWDSNFTPLLESHDPGEGEQKGGLLVAHYGKGIYIYTGYAFFRQLPAGVPGAVRLFVNLISGR